MNRMKQLFVLPIFLSFSGMATAQDVGTEQTGNDRFSIKAQTFMGFYIDKSSNVKAIDPSAPTGISMGIEFPSSQQRPWQQYLNNPTVGLGMTYLDLGADMMGKALSIYPYILLNCMRREHFELEVKLASGLSVVNEHWYTQKDQNPDHYGEVTTNTTFGSYLNVYLSGGLNMDFPITRNFTVNSEFAFVHMSNGRSSMPNVGANLFYGGVGMIATINPEVEKKPLHFPDLPRRWKLDVNGSAGVQQPDVGDRRYLIASLHAGAVYNLNNWYAVGGGMDIFYNGAINKESIRKLFRKDIDYTFLDKMRVGVGLNNEFRFGILTVLLDWGIYVFNPSRNYYLSDHPVYGHGKRPLIYKPENPSRDEGWHYWRFGLRCRVWDNLYVQVAAKMHLHISEHIGFGVGYDIPFQRNVRRTAA